MELTARDPALVAAAHLARRTNLAPGLFKVRSLADLPWDEAIDAVLAESPDGREVPNFDEFRDVVTWWLGAMTEPSNGLAERMAWFWHTLLTTNAWKVEHGALVAKQLTMLRKNAVGDFRSLLQAFVADGALLSYLDADGSVAQDPNENLGRELLELYSIGIGNYDQADVYAVSLAIAGFVVDRPSASVSVNPDAVHTQPVKILGQTKRWDAASVVDMLCDHPATAQRIVTLLWFELIGSPLAAKDAEALGRWWQENDLAIVPLVGRILRAPEFLESRLARPRSGLEFYCATRAAIPFPINDPWPARRLGQMPYAPPSPAGWPNDRWLNPGSLLGRAAHAQGWWFEDQLRAGPSNLDAVLDQAGIFEVSESTLKALQALDTPSDLPVPARNLVRWSAVFSAPEFQFA